MKFTQEQRTEAERQLRENPGTHRVRISLTPEQSADYRQAVELELAHRDQIIRDSQPLVRALRETTFSGELRRAISRCGRPREKLAAAVGIDGEQLRDFLWGAAVLPTDAVDRLIAELHLRARLECPVSSD